MNKKNLRRREFFRYAGLGFSGMAVPRLFKPADPLIKESAGSSVYRTILGKVNETLFVDTHEHLCNESERLGAGEKSGDQASDWSRLFSHYFSTDMAVSGMSHRDMQRFYSPDLGPADKWKLLEPFWPYLKHTGYGQNVAISIEKLYGITELNRESVRVLHDAYRDLISPGFYKTVLREKSLIESCQVDRSPLLRTEDPALLMTDMRINGLIEDPGNKEFSEEPGIGARDLADWHRVIDYWFDRYGRKIVAVKVSTAYSRDIDFEPTPAEQVESFCKRHLNGETLPPDELKQLQDHLFWYAVDKATGYRLPVKLHTGYYAGWNNLPLDRVSGNPAAASMLCKHSPETRFDFFHICYPYYEDLLSVAKNYPNAWLDMCWAWIINPIAARDFLKKFLVTVPAGKVLGFGGDYFAVELVPGHAAIARQGIALSLAELTETGYIELHEALDLVDHIMHGNARKLFRLEERKQELEGADFF